MIGVDIVSIERVSVLARRDWFVKYLLNSDELAYVDDVSRSVRHESISGVFAAKEACLKAAGVGFRDGARMRHVAVRWDEAGKPTLRFRGADYHASISHTDGYAVAICMAVL